MESQMYPDDFFLIGSECIDKFFSILDSSMIFTELSHTLRRDLAISMEEFVDEVDDDKCTGHKKKSYILNFGHLLYQISGLFD